MRQFRKLIFWMHLFAGVVAGVIILVMSVTGVALTYEKQMIAWFDGAKVTPPADAKRVGVEAIVAKVREANPGASPSGIVVKADPTAAVAVNFGREKTVYANPYSGEVLAEGASTPRAFFLSMLEWHRWLATNDENRAVGRAITGACNLAFLFLVVSGFYLWWPRQWTANLLRAVLWPSLKLSGKARDWNWHNAAGFWSAPALFFVVITGVIMSYPWANNLLYTLTGSEPPPARTGPPAGGATATKGGGSADAGKKEKSGAPGEGKKKRDGGGPGQGSGGSVEVAGLDAVWKRAEELSPGWQSITLRGFAAAGAPVTLAIDRSSGAARPDLRSTITIDPKTGEVVKHETYESNNAGRKLRLWSRYVHTGEAGGIVGQTIAGLVSAAGALLVWTGLALTWRRFFGSKKADAEAVDAEAVASEVEAVKVAQVK